MVAQKAAPKNVQWAARQLLLNSGCRWDRAGKLSKDIAAAALRRTPAVAKLLHECHNAMDGNSTTWWEPYGAAERSYLLFDLGGPTEISRLRKSALPPER